MIAYDTGHISSETVMEPVARGLGAKLIKPPWPRPLKGPGVFYGRDRGTLSIMRQCANDRVPWFMVDNGYFGARRYDGYYKISRNGFQCDGLGVPDYDRLAEVLAITGQSIRHKWRKRSLKAHVLICPPIVEYERCHWFSHTHWLRFVTHAVRKATERKFRLRYKPGDKRGTDSRTLEDDFTHCHAVVTHDSNIAVEAIMEGIPAFVTGTSPAQVFGNVDLALIDKPRRDANRLKWLAILANNQWTLDEIASGMACEAISRERIGP